MSIKLQCRLRLPYIIRLKEAKDFEIEFQFPEFEYFKLSLLFNDRDDEDTYFKDYDEKSCKYILVEITTNKYNYTEYRVSQLERVIDGQKSRVDYDVDKVPEAVEIDLMKDISPRINEIIEFIKVKSRMFWLEPIPINPTSEMLGVLTDYYFYAPSAKLDRNMRRKITTIDDYMESDSGVGGGKIFDSFFNDFASFGLDRYRISYDFLEKAKTSLYQKKYYESIIFAAVAQESFITKYIVDHAPQSDIVFEKLNEINGYLMDLKYNVVLKHIKGKSLTELNEECWNSIYNVYKLRNKIMHSGSVTVSDLKECGITTLDFRNINKLLDSIRKALDLIKSL